MSLFNADFYPTPPAVIEMMINDLDLAGKTVLEPSAGSGNILNSLTNMGAKTIACEKHPDLARITASKADKFLKNDFFDVVAEDISHVDYIVMNPPFSNADRHIQHAWDIAPGGCQIVALCNSETIKNRYSVRRTTFSDLIEKSGHYRNIGNVFSRAERTTDVEVALVHLFKPKSGDQEFDGYFFDMNDDQEESVNESGIMKHNDIREIVNRYVAGVKMFDSVIESNSTINNLISPISNGLGIAFGAYQTYTSRGGQYSTITREVFKRELQKSAWRSIFDKMNMQKYVTSGVMADINKFVEQQQQVPFTMTNIFRMLELIFGTHSGRMDRVLVEVFDRICSLSADNSEAGEKWKTNSSYKINRRFINPWMCEFDSRWPSQHVNIRIGSRESLIDDVVKALCFVTAKNYDQVMNMEYTDRYGQGGICNKTLYNFFSHNKTPWGQWVQWNEFFRVRGYKKGTMHFEFVDENVWMEFNLRVAKIKGWALPRKTDSKRKGTERTKGKAVEVFA